MPIIPEELLNVLLQQLQQSAQRRPDLISDPRTQRVATYLGRVISPEDTPAEVQRRFPQAELETGGIAMQAPELLKAVIPFAFWRRLAPEVKASFTYALNEQPELMRRALAIPKNILPDIERGEGTLGSAEPLSPNLHTLRIKPPPKLGRTEAGIDSMPRNFIPEALAGTGTHELTHVLQYPRVMATQPEDAGTIGMLLNDVIAAHDPWVNRGSLARVTRMLNDYLPTSISTNKNARSYQDILDAVAPLRYGGQFGPQMPTRDVFNRLSMDEGLATLAESARGPRASNVIKTLAENLGLGVVQKNAKIPPNWPEELTRSGFIPTPDWRY